MTSAKTFYTILDLSPTASAEDIKAAYRRLARQNHPDLNPNDAAAEDRFKQISEAYATLSDTGKKALYDAQLKQTAQQRSGKRPASGNASAKKPQASASPSPKSPPPPPPSAENKTNTAFREMFDSLFQGKAPPPPASPEKTSPTRGDDLTVQATITSAEAEKGVIKSVTVEHRESCLRCASTGKLNGKLCPACYGEKMTTTTRRIEVKIPPGVKTGSKVRVAKEGGRGQGGGESGDLYLVLTVETGSNIRTEGIDAYSTVSISIPEAMLGTTLDVPTLKGMLQVLVPALTPPGKVIRLKGQGKTEQGRTGDHYLTVQYQLPANLSAEQRQWYQKLKDSDD